MAKPGRYLIVSLLLLTCQSAPPDIEVTGSGAVKSSPPPKSESKAGIPLKAAVVASTKQAAEIGNQILQSGGHAVDAAIATAFALAITHPTAGNLGGGGFMMIYEAKEKKVYALDFRERAPKKAHRLVYPEYQPKSQKIGPTTVKPSQYGFSAVGVPGTIRGLYMAHRRFGNKPMRELLAPNIKLAREGSIVTNFTETEAKQYEQLLKNDHEVKREFFRSDARLYSAGDTIRQENLAKAFELLDLYGERAFYGGEIGKSLVEACQKNGGLIEEIDLHEYEAIWREPVEINWGDHTLYTMPLPSSGGVVIQQILFILKELGYSKLSETQQIHVLAEAMKLAFADRSAYLGDADYTKIPLSQMLNNEYLIDRTKLIDLNKAIDQKSLEPNPKWIAKESNETTHLTVVDEQGNIVSFTTTLNGSFGAKVMIPGYGIFLNNEMDDFTCYPGQANFFDLVQSSHNEIQPGKRMLSSMTPTIIIDSQGNPKLALGSPGGPRIITAVLQVILNVLDKAMPVTDAIKSPRIHHQWEPDTLFIEPAASAGLEAALKQLGHKVVRRKRGTEVAAIEFLENRQIRGAIDDREDGFVSGY